MSASPPYRHIYVSALTSKGIICSGARYKILFTGFFCIHYAPVHIICVTPPLLYFTSFVRSTNPFSARYATILTTHSSTLSRSVWRVTSGASGAS